MLHPCHKNKHNLGKIHQKLMYNSLISGTRNMLPCPKNLVHSDNKDLHVASLYDYWLFSFIISDTDTLIVDKQSIGRSKLHTLGFVLTCLPC